MELLQNITQTTSTASDDYILSLSDAKLHLNILDTSFDDLITDYLAAAHQQLFNETGILISATATGQLKELNDFYIDIYSINSIAVKYYDSNNDLQTWPSSNYIVNGQWVEIIGSEPTTYDREYPYVVEITTATSTNPMVVQALRMLVSDMFETRQTNVSGSSVNVNERATKWQLNLISKKIRY